MRSRSFLGRWALVASLVLWLLCPGGPPAAQDPPSGPEQEQEQEQEREEAGDPEDAQEQAEQKFIKMYVEQWKWTPDVIRVKQGTRLKIEFLSYDASRRFDLKAYKIKLPLPQDKPVTFEFVADKKGKFTFRCGRPCGDGCAKLTGKLIVE